MPRSIQRVLPLYLAAALAGIAAAYVLNEWFFRLRRTPPPRPDDTNAGEKPRHDAKSLPPLVTDSLPPPLPTPQANSFGTSSDPDGVHEQDGPDTSDEDHLDVLSPAPTHVISRRRSMRAHDLFAASHISFSELGSLVAPPDEPPHVT